ncbi:MAG: hypothetical protein ACE37K_22165 [Planctomycetota bacterium]
MEVHDDRVARGAARPQVPDVQAFVAVDGDELLVARDPDLLRHQRQLRLRQVEDVVAGAEHQQRGARSASRHWTRCQP